MSAQRMSSGGSSCLGRVLKITGGIMLGLWAIYFLATINLRSLGLPIGDWPRIPFYVYTASKITLTFDGQEIAIEGTTRCRRRFELNEDGDLWLPIILDHVGFAYYCEPKWFGHRFEDGSALLVGAYSYQSPRSSRRVPSEHFYPLEVAESIVRRPPSVVWLDNADAPTRAEYFYSAAILDDRASRLTRLGYSAEMYPQSAWTNIFTPLAASGTPDLRQREAAIPSEGQFVGYYAVELPKARWSTIDGLPEQLSQLSDPTFLRAGAEISEDQIAGLRRVLADGDRSALPIALQTSMSIPTDALAAAPPSTTPQDGYAVIPVERAMGVFRLDDNAPQGVLKMYFLPDSYRAGTAEIQLGKEIISEPNRKVWESSFLFDPASERILSFAHISQAPGTLK